MKPVETGVPRSGPEDARALRLAAGVDDALEEICPQRFALPASPEVAARAEGRSVSLDAIRSAWSGLARRRELMLVEGAGGLLVPLDARTDMADLARELALPLLVVARARLGTINHTRLTLEAAAARGVELFGVVISHADGELGDADARNLASLRERLGTRLLAEVPPQTSVGDASMDDPQRTALLASPLAPLVARIANAIRGARDPRVGAAPGEGLSLRSRTD